MSYKNEIFEAEITGMTQMGYGVARKEDGEVVFVRGGVTGDTAEIGIIKARAGGVTVGRIARLIRPSPLRENDLCPSKRCGGCSYGSVIFAHELELKRDTVVAALRKQNISAEVAECVTDGRRERYRNKICVPVSGEKYGYYERHSHELADCSGCVLAPEAFGDIVKACAGAGLPLRHICIRTGTATGETMLFPVFYRAPDRREKDILLSVAERFPAVSSVVCNVNDRDTNVILGDVSETLLGRDGITDTLLGCRFEISHRSFYQVNRGVTELLYGAVSEMVSESGAEKVADLFCGIGTIGIVCASQCRGISVTGTEIVVDAVKNARKNAEANGIDNAVFACGSADSVPRGSELVIVDPPRKGLSQGLVDSLISSGAGEVIYVSCNPGTFARDAAALISSGFSIGTVTPFNMFPRTGAVECLAGFTR